MNIPSDVRLIIAQQAHLMWFEDQKTHRKYNNKLYGSLYREIYEYPDDKTTDDFFLNIIKHSNLKEALTYFRNLPGLDDTSKVYYRCERCNIKHFGGEYDCCYPCFFYNCTKNGKWKIM